MTALIVTVSLAVASAVGPRLILPALSVLLLGIGFFVAFVHRRDPANSERLTYKDVGAALVFIAFAAALISSPTDFLLLTGSSDQATSLP
jgi:hypothetical protein